MRFALFLLAGSLLFAQDTPQSEEARIRDLVRQLTDDELQIREEATHELLRLGTERVTAIERAVALARDQETRLTLLKAIGVVPPPESISEESLFALRLPQPLGEETLLKRLEGLKRLTGIPFEVDPLADLDVEIDVEAAAEGESIRKILDDMTLPNDYAWYVASNRRIVLTNTEMYALTQVKLQLFDVRHLAHRVFHRDLPDEPLMEEEPVMELIGGEDLVQKIREEVEPESWDKDERDIFYQNGLLICRCTEDIARRIEAYLDQLRDEIAEGVRSRFWFVLHPPGTMEDPIGEVTDARAGEILRGRRLGGLERIGFSGQTLAGFRGAERVGIEGYDDQGIPKLTSLKEGVRLTYRARLDDARRNALVHLVAVISKVTRWEPVLTAKGVVHTSDVSEVRVRATRNVPLGRYAILYRGGNVAGFGGEAGDLVVLGRFEYEER